MAVPVRRTVLESMKQMSDLDSYLAQADWSATLSLAPCHYTTGTAAVTAATLLSLSWGLGLKREALPVVGCRYLGLTYVLFMRIPFGVFSCWCISCCFKQQQ